MSKKIDLLTALSLNKELKDKNKLLELKITSLEDKIKSMAEEIIELHKQLALAKALRYAIKSEKKRKLPQDDKQLSLFDEAECFQFGLAEQEANADTTEESNANTTATPAVSKPRKKRGRRPLPADLPRVDRIIDIPDEEKVCACGHPLKKIGEEISEKLNIIPAKIQVIRHIRYKYACPHCEGTEDEKPAVRIAPLPPQLIPRGIVTPSLLTFLIIHKFANALPLYRQSAMLARLGIDISRSTMSSWILAAAAACLPLRDRLYQQLRSGPTINIDETPTQVLGEENRKNTTKSYMWVACGGEPGRSVRLFTYTPTRAGKEAAQIIGNFTGFLQTDGYKGYEAVGAREGIIHVGCLVHVRRKFFEAANVGEKKIKGTASAVVDLIAKIYQLEKSFKKEKLSPEQILEAREKSVRPLLNAIEERMRAAESNVLPSSLLGKAIAYGLNQWTYILNYLQCPSLTPDNNVAENAIRPFVVGRKNWLFSGSPRGADASALFYSLIESAKANDLNPQQYLWETLEKLPLAKNDADFEALMPWKRE